MINTLKQLYQIFIYSLLWYLTEDLNLLCLFDRNVGLTTKCAMVKVSENVVENETLSQTRVDLTSRVLQLPRPLPIFFYLLQNRMLQKKSGIKSLRKKLRFRGRTETFFYPGFGICFILCR